MGKKKGKGKSGDTPGGEGVPGTQQPQPSTSRIEAPVETPTPVAASVVPPQVRPELTPQPVPPVEPAQATARIPGPSSAEEQGVKKSSGKQKKDKKKKPTEPAVHEEVAELTKTLPSKLELKSEQEQGPPQPKQQLPPPPKQQPQPKQQPPPQPKQQQQQQQPPQPKQQQQQPQPSPSQQEQRQPPPAQQLRQPPQVKAEEIGVGGDVAVSMPQQPKKKGKQAKKGEVVPIQPETGARPKFVTTAPQQQVPGLQFGQVPTPKVILPEPSAKRAPEIGSGDAPTGREELRGIVVPQPSKKKEQIKPQRPPQKVQPAPISVIKPSPPVQQLSEADKGLKPPTRKDFGRRGNAIKLRANHFQVKIDPKKRIYHYDVEIRPELKAMKGLKRNIVESMIKSNNPVFGRAACVFDGEKNLYSSAQLPLGPTGQHFEVNLEDKKEKFTVEIKKVAEILLSDLQDFLDSKTRTMPQHAVQALDIVFRHLPTLRFITLGRSIFPITDRGFDLGGGVEMWRGYYQSLRPGQWKQLQLNLDVSNRTFYKAQNMLDFAVEFFELRSQNDLRNLQQNDWSKFAREVKGMSVQVTHTLMPRKYKLIGLSQYPAELQKFPLTQNETTVDCTVAKFFMDTYKMRLTFGRIPCLQAQPADKHRYLPMEVCRIPVGQQYKKLSDYQTASMIRKTAVPAHQRKQDIENLMRNANLNQDPYVRGFGLSVSDELMCIDGRVLPPPSLQLNSSTPPVKPYQGVWDMRQKQFFTGARIDVWGIINMARCHQDIVKNFSFQLRKVARDIGVVMSDSAFYYELQRSLPEHTFRDLKQKFAKLQLILAILPGKTPLYADIKRMGDTEFGITTQCVQVKNVNASNPATLTNILMKINAKMGGINSILSKEIRSPVFRTPVIFLGADVTHPPAGDKSKPSIAAIVGSMDMNAQVYSAKVCVQEHRKEIIVDLKAQVRELLLEFYRTLRLKPTRIIFYRDGVGEGQFYEVLRHELVAIRGACHSLSQEYEPPVTFLVVQKRHHTRLFCDNPRDTVGRANNVPPGTTVDTAITHPVENDFFLCSHQGIQGTSRPTHYHVLWDDSNFSADELHQLTFELCHTYVRCTRSVSIPAPAYYAHLVAFRARYHLEKLQERVDQERGDPNIWLDRMQEAVKIHERTGTMYYV